MERFDLDNPNMAFLRTLPRALLDVALRAEFIDEPIWSRRDCLQVIAHLNRSGHAITNIYVYAAGNGKIALPGSVYDKEIEDQPLGLPWREIVMRSNRLAMDFVAGSGFYPAEQAAVPAFSMWAFDEHRYRSFVR